MYAVIVTLLALSAEVSPAPSGSSVRVFPDQSTSYAQQVQNIKLIEPRTPITRATTPGDEDSLFKITAPGSYYLVDNIDGVAGKIGIEIVSSRVSVDLLGFDLSGVPGSREGIIVAGDDLTNISITNGSIRNWGRSGVFVYAETANTHLSDLRVVGCGHEEVSQAGVAAGRQAQVTRCSFHANAGWGMTANYRSQISDCVATENGLDGFWTTEQCTLSRCTSTSNTGNGFDLRHGTIATECKAHGNLMNGFFVEGAGCQVLNCNAGDNMGAGLMIPHSFFGSYQHRIDGNHFFRNSTGIHISSGSDHNLIIRNSASGNVTNYLIKDNGNAVGPIVDVTGGVDFLSVPHANHPWANFVH